MEAAWINRRFLKGGRMSLSLVELALHGWVAVTGTPTVPQVVVALATETVAEAVFPAAIVWVTVSKPELALPYVELARGITP